MTEGVELAFHSWEKKQIADKKKKRIIMGKKISSKIFRILYSQHNQEGFLPQYANAECSRIISIIEKRDRIS